jgi:hypothetical protein
MRQTNHWRVAVVAAALSFTAIANPTSLPAAGNAHANGGGTVVEGGEKSTFAFNAVQQTNGSVAGHLTYHFRLADVTFHMQNDCLKIVGTNKAVIAGTVTMVTGTSLPFIVQGARGVFQVQDNGEANDVNPDLISDVIIYPVGFQADCMVVPPNPYLPIDGNVTVKP